MVQILGCQVWALPGLLADLTPGWKGFFGPQELWIEFPNYMILWKKSCGIISWGWLGVFKVCFWRINLIWSNWGLVPKLFGDLAQSYGHQIKANIIFWTIKIWDIYPVLRQPPWLMPGKQTWQWRIPCRSLQIAFFFCSEVKLDCRKEWQCKSQKWTGETKPFLRSCAHHGWVCHFILEWLEPYVAPPGMAFKFVCLGHNGIPRWEENRPNRHGRGSRRQNGRSIHVVPSDKLK